MADAISNTTPSETETPDPRTVPFERLDWDQKILVRALEDAERLAGGAA